MLSSFSTTSSISYIPIALDCHRHCIIIYTESGCRIRRLRGARHAPPRPIRAELDPAARQAGMRGRSGPNLHRYAKNPPKVGRDAVRLRRVGDAPISSMGAFTVMRMSHISSGRSRQNGRASGLRLRVRAAVAGRGALTFKRSATRAHRGYIERSARPPPPPRPHAPGLYRDQIRPCRRRPAGGHTRRRDGPRAHAARARRIVYGGPRGAAVR